MEMYDTALRETRYGSVIVIAVCAVDLRAPDLEAGLYFQPMHLAGLKASPLSIDHPRKRKLGSAEIAEVL